CLSVGGKRIGFNRLSDLCSALLLTSRHPLQMKQTVPILRLNVARVQFQGPQEFEFRAWLIPRKNVRQIQSVVGFGKRRVNFNRAICRSFGPLQAGFRGYHAVKTEHVKTIRQTGPGQSVVLIQRHSMLEALQSLAQAGASLKVESAALQ